MMHGEFTGGLSDDLGRNSNPTRSCAAQARRRPTMEAVHQVRLRQHLPAIASALSRVVYSLRRLAGTQGLE